MRTVLAVIAGYLVIFAVVFLAFSAAYLAMGADSAFQPGSYEVTGLWIAVSLVLSFAAAAAGGYVCAAIGRTMRAAWALAGLVVVLGFLMAIPVMTTPADTQAAVRAAETGNFEAMGNARQPVWLALLNPFIGAAGVMLGARLRAPAEAKPWA
jgi:hypothetical protein